MATLALAAVGTAVAPSIFGAAAGTALIGGLTVGAVGGIVGGTLGGFLDATVINPLLFGKKNTNAEGLRLSDLSLTPGSEGSPIRRCYGAEVRVPGGIFWVSDIKEVKSKKKVSGSKGGGGASASSTTYTYYASFAIAVCEGEILDILKVWANSKVIYDRGKEDARYKSISIYKGNQTQTADAVIVANQTVDNAGFVPGYRGIAYVVIEDLDLRDFGNASPNFTFLVAKKADAQLSTMISDVLLDQGLSSGDFDVTQVAACCRGMSVSGPQSAVTILEPLLLTYNLLVQNSGSKLVFSHRELTSNTTVPSEDLAAREYGSESVVPVSVEESSDFDLPTQVGIEFLDWRAEYQAGEVVERRINRPTGTENVEQTSLPVVLDQQEARALARRILWTNLAERRRVTFTLSIKYRYLQEGDVLLVPYAGSTIRVRLTKIAFGVNSVLECEGLAEQPSTLVQTGPADNRIRSTPTGPYTPPVVQLKLFDAPMLTVDHDTPGIFYAMYTKDPTASYRGAVLYMSANSSTGFSVQATSSAEGTVGKTLGRLKAPSSFRGTYDTRYMSVASIDETVTVDVELYNGTLESVTQDEMVLGANWCIIGQEVLAFLTATSLGNNKWRLSKLWRGLRGTEDLIASHSNGEPFVLLADGLEVAELSLADRDVTRYFRGVALQANVADSPNVTTKPGLRTLKPLAPILSIRWKGSSDHEFSWIPRSRFPYRIFSGRAPLDAELYDIEIRKGSTVVRTVQQTARSYTYTSANRSTDGVTNGYTVRIYSIHPQVGRGVAAEGVSP